MARAKSPFPKSRLSIYLRKSMEKDVIELLEDPAKPGTIPYGAFSLYVSKLIANDLRERNFMGQEALDNLLVSLDKDGA